MEVGVQYAVSDVLLFCLFVTEMSFNIVTNHELLALEKGCLSAKSQELATEKCSSSFGDKNPCAHRRQRGVMLANYLPRCR